MAGCKVREEDVMRKVNRHLLSRFLMLTMLCYLVCVHQCSISDGLIVKHGTKVVVVT